MKKIFLIDSKKDNTAAKEKEDVVHSKPHFNQSISLNKPILLTETNEPSTQLRFPSNKQDSLISRNLK